MQNILLTIGIVLGTIAMIVVDTFQILTLKSKKTEEISNEELLEKLYFGSAVGMLVLLIFWIISCIF